MASPNGQCYRFIAILSVNVIVTPCISIDIIYVRVSIAHDSSHWSYYSYWEKVYIQWNNWWIKEGTRYRTVYIEPGLWPSQRRQCFVNVKEPGPELSVVCVLENYSGAFYRPFPGKNSRETILLLFHCRLYIVVWNYRTSFFHYM